MDIADKITKPSKSLVYTKIISSATIIYVTAVTLALFFVPPGHGLKEALTALGAAVALATGIIAPLATLYNSQYQTQVTAAFQEEVEKFKQVLTIATEAEKAHLTGRIGAFDRLHTAAHLLYFAARKLLIAPAEWGADLAKEADRNAAEASSAIWYLSEEEQALWWNLYQTAINLLQEMQGKPEDVREELFNKVAPEIGNAMRQLREAGRFAVLELRKISSPLAVVASETSQPASPAVKSAVV